MKSKFNTATPIFITYNKIWTKDCRFMQHAEPIDIIARNAIAPLSWVLHQIQSDIIFEVFAKQKSKNVYVKP